MNSNLRQVFCPGINRQEQNLRQIGRDLSVFRDIGIQQVRRSDAESFERTYAPDFRAWIKFQGQTMAVWCFSEATFKSVMVWMPTDLAACCGAAEGNQVGRIKSKIIAVNSFSRAMRSPSRSRSNHQCWNTLSTGSHGLMQQPVQGRTRAVHCHRICRKGTHRYRPGEAVAGLSSFV